MEKLLNISLNKYAIVPHGLRGNPAVNSPASTVSVSLASLYHHYYLDSYGIGPPSPDPVQFEHTRFLLPTRDFRFQGSGLGISPAIKRHRSNELGQAFCRWFLHDHLNITYFAHLEHILNRQLHRAFGGCHVTRSKDGDTPDYFCAESVDRVFLAEAKGRYSSISFANQQFALWRKQFDRVAFLDATGVARRVKGHIVATRFATEEDSERLMSGIWAEDPESRGERPLDPESVGNFGGAIIATHYSNLAAKLGQPILAAALANGVSLPDEMRVVGVAWQILLGPLKGQRFVGGYFGGTEDASPFRESNGRFYYANPDPLRLDRPNRTFFGLEESIFRSVVDYARKNQTAIPQIPTIENTDFFYSGFSVLRDGSALGPLDFFSPVEQVAF